MLCGQALQAGRVEGVEHADHHRAGTHRGHFGFLRRPNLEHHLRAQRLLRVAQHRSHGRICSVGHAGPLASTALHVHRVPLRDKFLDGLRGRCHPRFPRRRFSGHSYLHWCLLVFLAIPAR
jgi:hypothetical protein